MMEPRATGAEREAEKLMVTMDDSELPTVSALKLVTGMEGVASGGFVANTVTDELLPK